MLNKLPVDILQRISEYNGFSLFMNLTDAKESVSCICVNDQYLIGGSNDKCVYVWDVKTGELKYNLIGHTDWVKGVTFWKDGLILSCGYDQNILCWDLTTKDTKGFRAIHHDTEQISAIATQGDVVVFGLETLGRCSMKKMVDGVATNFVDWEGDYVARIEIKGDNVVAVHDDGVICVWSLETTKMLKRIGCRFVALQPLRIGSKTDTIFANTSLGDLTTFPLNGKGVTGRVWNKFKEIPSCIHDNGELLVTGTSSGQVIITSLKTEDRLQSFKAHNNFIENVIMHNDMIITCSMDHTVRIWKRPTLYIPTGNL